MSSTVSNESSGVSNEPSGQTVGLGSPPLLADPKNTVLSARKLIKTFGKVVGLDGVDVDLFPGEVLAVIGDNGAGKSTLIKAMTGAIIPDSGQVYLDGKEVHFKSPQDARSARASRRSTRPWRWPRRWTSRPTCSWVGNSCEPVRSGRSFGCWTRRA